jgi:hypothetical protein
MRDISIGIISNSGSNSGCLQRAIFSRSALLKGRCKIFTFKYIVIDKVPLLRLRVAASAEQGRGI